MNGVPGYCLSHFLALRDSFSGAVDYHVLIAHVQSFVLWFRSCDLLNHNHIRRARDELIFRSTYDIHFPFPPLHLTHPHRPTRCTGDPVCICPANPEVHALSPGHDLSSTRHPTTRYCGLYNCVIHVTFSLEAPTSHIDRHHLVATFLPKTRGRKPNLWDSHHPFPDPREITLGADSRHRRVYK